MQSNSGLITIPGLEMLHSVLHVFVQENNLFTKPSSMNQTTAGLFHGRGGMRLRKDEMLFMTRG